MEKDTATSSSKKIVLITGTSSGIGEAAAIAFAKKNYHVVATLRNKDKISALLELAKKENVELDVRLLDVCSDQSVEACIQSVLNDFGRIDVLVNNAGGGYRGTLEQIPLKDLQYMMDVNFFSVARVTKAVFPSMRTARKGRIITVSSLAGLIAIPFSDAYCAAKFAVEGLMEALSPVASAFGIHISLIEPGPVATHFFENVMGKESFAVDNPYSGLAANYSKNTPVRLTDTAQTPAEIAQVILNAATTDKPSLRYPTSPVAAKMAAGKYVDVTGNSVVKATGQMLSPTVAA